MVKIGRKQTRPNTLVSFASVRWRTLAEKVYWLLFLLICYGRNVLDVKLIKLINIVLRSDEHKAAFTIYLSSSLIYQGPRYVLELRGAYEA